MRRGRARNDDATATLPNGAAGRYLIGMVCLKQQQRQRAIKYFTRCLRLDPFMWSAYEALSQLGAPLPAGLSAPDATSALQPPAADGTPAAMPLLAQASPQTNYPKQPLTMGLDPTAITKGCASRTSTHDLHLAG